MNGSSSIHLTMFGLNPVVKFGNDRLKQTFLPRAATGDLHVAFGVTEPDAGTDTSRITTRATDDGMGGWIVNGRKIWTSKALESEVVLLLVRTDHDESNRFGGLTLFLADLDPDYVDISPIPKLGRNAVASCEVVYDDLPVEGWRMVGERGRGFQHLLHGLNPERILLAATACGIGEAAIRRAVAYAKERIVFDRPIGANQAIAHPLAKAHMELGAAFRMMQLAAWRYDHDLDCGEAANTAKYLAAEACFFAADQALQTHGGLGYAVGVPRRALLARGPPAAAGSRQPGDDLQLHRPERARPPAQLLRLLRGRPIAGSLRSQLVASRRFAHAVVRRLDLGELLAQQRAQLDVDVVFHRLFVFGDGVVLALLGGVEHAVDVIAAEGILHRHPAAVHRSGDRGT